MREAAIIVRRLMHNFISSRWAAVHQGGTGRIA